MPATGGYLYSVFLIEDTEGQQVTGAKVVTFAESVLRNGL